MLLQILCWLGIILALVYTYLVSTRKIIPDGMGAVVLNLSSLLCVSPLYITKELYQAFVLALIFTSIVIYGFIKRKYMTDDILQN